MKNTQLIIINETKTKYEIVGAEWNDNLFQTDANIQYLS